MMSLSEVLAVTMSMPSVRVRGWARRALARLAPETPGRAQSRTSRSTGLAAQDADGPLAVGRDQRLEALAGVSREEALIEKAHLLIILDHEHVMMFH